MALTYEWLREQFAWSIPDLFNMGVACSDAHDPERPALIAVDSGGAARTHTYGELTDLSNRLANVLAGQGVRRGDRVGVVIPQSLETGIAHLAIWKLGAISLPLASLFGPDALGYRLSDSGASAVLATPELVGRIAEAAPGVPAIVTGNDLDRRIAASAPDFSAARTEGEDPAYLIYTSGTTGPPKGALHAHRSLFGHLPGFESYYEFADRPPEGRSDLAALPHPPEAPADGLHDVIWTPADWAWIGGLMDVLVPAWYFGMTVLTADHDFDPEWACDLMAEHGVTLAFLPPTALKMMRAAGVARSDLSLRAIFSGGEPLGEEILRWTEESLGSRINEGYGQTECNLVVGNCGSTWDVRPGSMGRSLPGHEVVVQAEDGNRLIGEVGEICVRAPDPVMMLGYWNRADATRDKYRDGWMLTGDLGREDEDGYLWYESRKDDVISSMGYRIGPGEIEESLIGHPAVAMCAVVGVPDDLRGQIPAAFVVLREGFAASDHLAADLQSHVRTRLAAHEVPRRVTFVDDLPRTTTGKIMRRALREREVLPD